MIWVDYPGSDPGSGSCFFTHPGFRGQKGNESRIRIRNTAFCNNLRCEAVMLCCKTEQFRICYTVAACVVDPDPDSVLGTIRFRVPNPYSETGKKVPQKIKNENLRTVVL